LYNRPKWPQYQGLIDTYGLSIAPPIVITIKSTYGDFIGSKHVVEDITYESEHVGHRQFTNTTRSRTFKTAPANEIVNQCNRMLKYNITERKLENPPL
jgi:hypothetical protein